MNTKILEESNNKLAMISCVNLYLDSDTADVNFVFKIDEDRCETVPAHKNILSAGSPVFKAMFYGPMKEIGDVKIVDASIMAFEEFLRFFYLEKVRLTPKHIFAVTKLCHMYEVSDGLKSCEKLISKALTVDNMCTAYELAILLELNTVAKFCEEQITRNSDGILKSNDFMSCIRNTVGIILDLVSMTSDASMILNACMSWAKASCDRNNQEPTMANLKAVLGNLIEKIPFDRLFNKEFDDFCTSYDGLLNVAEMKVIISKLLTNNGPREKVRKTTPTTRAAAARRFRRISPIPVSDSDDNLSDISFSTKICDADN